uniref:Abnormal cell migration protein 18-like fibronectin type I domain-containing protein n=1 Tax=Strongyloides papillosus TaxID=174720 RepID=A0A0N5C6H8_STREA
MKLYYYSSGTMFLLIIFVHIQHVRSEKAILQAGRITADALLTSTLNVTRHIESPIKALPLRDSKSRWGKSSCLSEDGTIRRHGEEFIPEGKEFWHACDNGNFKIIACRGSIKSGRARIPLDSTIYISGFWYKCIDRENGEVEYQEEPTCEIGNRHYHDGDFINTGGFRMICTRSGHAIIGCYYKDGNGTKISMNPGDRITYNGTVILCRQVRNKFFFQTMETGCRRDGKVYNNDEIWVKGNIVFKCEFGLINIVACQTGDGQRLSVGNRIVQDKHTLHTCTRESDRVVRYTMSTCGKPNFPACEPTAIEPPQINLETGDIKELNEHKEQLKEKLKIPSSDMRLIGAAGLRFLKSSVVVGK